MVITCPECGLEYEDKKVARQCEEYCKTHGACSLDITKHAKK